MKKDRKKENNTFTIIFIVLLILVSIAYASLAENLGVKVIKGGQKEVIIQEFTPPIAEEPVKEEPSIPVTPSKTKKPTPSPSSTPTPTPTPEPTSSPRPPIIKPPVEPGDIDWSIEFDNIKELAGSVTPVSPATIDTSRLNINFSIVLKVPGEYYSFTADIVNKGNVDAEIYNIIETGLSAQQRKFLSFNVTYSDGTQISPGDYLLKGQSKKIKVIVKFKDNDLVASDLPKTQQTLNLSYKITYVEKG